MYPMDACELDVVYADFLLSYGPLQVRSKTIYVQGLSQVKRRAGVFTQYVIIPLGEHEHKSSCLQNSRVRI